MIKLINFSTDVFDLNKFENNEQNLNKFLCKHDMNGIELIQSIEPWNPQMISKALIKGLHMRFWPIWLDFWREDKEELLRQFGTEQDYKNYYGGNKREVMIEYYREELKTAARMEVEYVVFHVSHVQMEHSYNWQFTYSDDEVIDAFIDMLNLVLEDLDFKFDILLENLWWPGLTLLSRKQCLKVLERINYPKLGFMLDIGHLMNTEVNLRSEEEAVKYILKKIDDLGEVSNYIKGIHLNSSLAGKYIKKIQNNQIVYNPKDNFFNKCMNSFSHISKIDHHEPFLDVSIRNVLDRVNPRYLVYEVITKDLDDLDEKISLQNKVLKEKDL